MPWLDTAEACAEAEGVGELNGCLEGACALSEEETALWKPLVLLIPLRLGLSDINEAYIETLKASYLQMYESDISPPEKKTIYFHFHEEFQDLSRSVAVIYGGQCETVMISMSTYSQPQKRK